MVQSAFNYLFESKLYIWKRGKVKPEVLNKRKIENNQSTNRAIGNKLTGDKLKDLAWSLDVLDLKNRKEEN
jgi:hypothetical protein